jgi:hypothetical protein
MASSRYAMGIIKKLTRENEAVKPPHCNQQLIIRISKGYLKFSESVRFLSRQVRP